MNDVRFYPQISHRSRNVASSFEARECLDQQWPDWAWTELAVCRDVLDGWHSALPVSHPRHG